MPKGKGYEKKPVQRTGSFTSKEEKKRLAAERRRRRRLVVARET